MEQAYHTLNLGYCERSVCLAMGIDPDFFAGVLKKALEEAMWERGYYLVGAAPKYQG